MSFGFHAHEDFKVVAAIDAQIGKPSLGKGKLECNLSYEANIGIKPLETDINKLLPNDLKNYIMNHLGFNSLNILLACPPCTGFSRTLPKNHLVDDQRNSLVIHCSGFVEALKPDIFIMENARELITGNFRHHYGNLSESLKKLGYVVSGSVFLFSDFGLPQKRERAILVAAKSSYVLRTLRELWAGYGIAESVKHVRRAISHLPSIECGITDPNDPLHVSPSLNITNLERLKSIPKNGGSWADLIGDPRTEELLTPSMKRYINLGKLGSHPDVYGRLWWDKPSITIKRECAHIGNGRYAHPEQNRLCTVREMSIMQGFPDNYNFVASSLSNIYRHIGDAVPPLISYQLAHLCKWILEKKKPKLKSIVLKNTTLNIEDIVEDEFLTGQQRLAL